MWLNLAWPVEVTKATNLYSVLPGNYTSRPTISRNYLPIAVTLRTNLSNSIWTHLTSFFRTKTAIQKLMTCKSPSIEFPNKGSDNNKRGPLLMASGSLQRLPRRNSANHKDVRLQRLGVRETDRVSLIIHTARYESDRQHRQCAIT
jgi:hypothetical protein